MRFIYGPILHMKRERKRKRERERERERERGWRRDVNVTHLNFTFSSASSGGSSQTIFTNSSRISGRIRLHICIHVHVKTYTVA